MRFILGVIYLIVTGAVLVSQAALVCLGKKCGSNRMYFGCLSMVVIWCSSQLMQLMCDGGWQLKFSYLYGNIGICFIGVTWVYFALYYRHEKYEKIRETQAEKTVRDLMSTEKTTSGQEGRIVSFIIKHRSFFEIFRFLPVAISSVMYLVILTNDLHHLYYSHFGDDYVEHGPLFYVNVVFTYFFVFLGALILYINYEGGIDRATDKDVSRGRLLIVTSVLAPVFFNLLYLVGLIQADFDITPLGFAISVFLVMMATFKYQFIDLRKELALTNEKLLLSQERNRIAQQVHDTTGHTLTMLSSYMKLAEVSVKDEKKDEALEYIRDARSLASGGITELRETINLLRTAPEHELVTQGVMQLAGMVKEIPVEVTIRGEDSPKYSHLSRVVYDTVRESITNSLKYAKASRIDVVIKFQEKEIDLTIADDGCGCSEIKDNNGLRGIRERIAGAGGEVRFISSEGGGFLTGVKLRV